MALVDNNQVYQSPLLASLKGTKLHLTVLTLAMTAAAVGPWPQRFGSESLGAYGLLWGLICMLAVLAISLNLSVPTGAQIHVALFSVPAAIGIGHSLTGITAGAIPIVMTLVLLPAGFCTAMTAAVRRPDTTERRLVRSFEVAAVLLMVAMILKLLLYGGDGRELSSRPFGHGAAIALLVLASSAKRPLAVFRTLPGLAAVVTMALSLSRTSWLMCAFGMAVLMWVAYDRSLNRPLRILLMIIMMVCTFWLLITEVPLIRRRFTGQNESTITLSSREEIWPSVLDAIPNRLLFGHGPGESAAFVRSITAGDNANPHNDFLRISYDIGVVSLLSLLIGLLMVSWALRGRQQYGRLAKAGLVLPLIFPIFLIFTNGLTYLGVSVPAFVVMGAAVGVAKRDKL
jgi:O-antigen ligase